MRVVDVNRVVDLTRELETIASADEAWLVHDQSRRRNPEEHDAALIEACVSSGAWCLPQLVLAPPFVNGAEDPRLGDALQGSCRVLRLCPADKGHGYPLVDWVLSPLPESCERENLALATDYQNSQIPWTEMVGFARSFLAVPMIVIGAAVGDDRTLSAALQVAPNLIVELSGLCAADALPPLLEQFGAHRFAFGSGARSTQELTPLQYDPTLLAVVLPGTADALADGTWRDSYL